MVNVRLVFLEFGPQNIDAGIPNYLLVEGWLVAQICMINSPVPGDHLENNQHSYIISISFQA